MGPTCSQNQCKKGQRDPHVGRKVAVMLRNNANSADILVRVEGIVQSASYLKKRGFCFVETQALWPKCQMIRLIFTSAYKTS